MIAVFDLDHTLISANSSYCFGAFLFRKGHISFLKTITLIAAYCIHKLGILSLRGLHTYCFHVLFKNRTAQQIHVLAEQFLDEKLTDLLNPLVVQRLAQYQANGTKTYLFSSSPNFLVEGIANRLQIGHTLSTEYSVDLNGKFDAIKRLVTGCEKEQELERIKANSYTIAFSDSILDVQLLLKADQVVCVCPDTQLHRLAMDRGWEVLT